MLRETFLENQIKLFYSVPNFQNPSGDVILKGANAIDMSQRRATILIGHPKGGTIAVALWAVIGRRVDNIEFHNIGFLTYMHKGEPLDAVVSQLALHHLPG